MQNYPILFSNIINFHAENSYSRPTELEEMQLWAHFRVFLVILRPEATTDVHPSIYF